MKFWVWEIWLKLLNEFWIIKYYTDQKEVNTLKWFRTIYFVSNQCVLEALVYKNPMLWCSVSAPSLLRPKRQGAKKRKYDGDNTKERKHDGEGAITRWRQSDGFIAPSPSCFRFVAKSDGFIAPSPSCFRFDAIVLSRYRCVVIVFSLLRSFAFGS